MTRRCSIFVVHLLSEVIKFLRSTWTTTSSPGSIVTKTVVWVVHVYYDVVFEVNRNQTMFFVVHVDYDVLSEVIIHDRTIFYVVHADYDVIFEVDRD